MNHVIEKLPDLVVMPMKIFLPYSKLQTATLIALIGYDFAPVELKGEYAYGEYFKARWAEGQSFINLEHDCVPWPGAIEAIEDCERDWCLYNYSLPIHREQNLEIVEGGMPLGLVKFSAELIIRTKGAWDEPIDWSNCDNRLTKACKEAGFTPHQHYPSIVNANPVLLPLVKGKHT